ESLTDETDIIGRYNVDISSSAWNVLEITALYHQFRANETLIVSGEPAQRQDLMLAMLSHIIKGLVLKPDATPARIFSVVVANQNTNESDFVITNTTGHYRMDIGVYESSFSVGDPVIISCNFIGFSDTNSTIVTNTSEQVVNLFLSDVEPPKPTIFDAPGSVPVNTGFNIVAWVTDNFQVTSVSLYLREVGQGIYSMLEMYVDDGAGHDWDSNGFPEPRLFGRSIAAQSDIGTVYYYVEADDGSFTNTTPENNPETNPYEILITDSLSPTITHTPVSEMEAGVPRNLLALVDDNIEVDDVILWLAQVGEMIYSPMIMTPTGTDMEYNATIPAQLALGTLR
ncbi:MAG: hypothetical protein KAX31_00345, partial [Thermoplasmata archaeon]|nr:hypothetical protein [Thermoplasmata archaeon]